MNTKNISQHEKRTTIILSVWKFYKPFVRFGFINMSIVSAFAIPDWTLLAKGWIAFIIFTVFILSFSCLLERCSIRKK